jgi:hypothetical protein
MSRPIHCARVAIRHVAYCIGSASNLIMSRSRNFWRGAKSFKVPTVVNRINCSRTHYPQYILTFHILYRNYKHLLLIQTNYLQKIQPYEKAYTLDQYIHMKWLPGEKMNLGLALQPKAPVLPCIFPCSCKQ